MREPVAQTLVRFAVGPALGDRRGAPVPLSSSRWKCSLTSLLEERQMLVWPEPELFVRQGGTALTIGARTPAGSRWLHEHLRPLMESVAAVAGRALNVQVLDMKVQCADTGFSWEYEIPCWVVALPKRGKKHDWAQWRAELLGPEQRDRLARQATEQIQAGLRVWGVDSLAEKLKVAVVHDGRAMILKEATSNGPKPVSAMARLAVRISSNLRLQGVYQVGRLQALGQGRLFRDGVGGAADEAADVACDAAAAV